MSFALASYPGFDLFLAAKIENHIRAQEVCDLEKERSWARNCFTDCCKEISHVEEGIHEDEDGIEYMEIVTRYNYLKSKDRKTQFDYVSFELHGSEILYPVGWIISDSGRPKPYSIIV